MLNIIPYDVNISHVVQRNNIDPNIFRGDFIGCPGVEAQEKRGKTRALVTALGPFKAAFLTGIGLEEMSVIIADPFNIQSNSQCVTCEHKGVDCKPLSAVLSNRLGDRFTITVPTILLQTN